MNHHYKHVRKRTVAINYSVCAEYLNEQCSLNMGISRYFFLDMLIYLQFFFIKIRGLQVLSVAVCFSILCDATATAQNVMMEKSSNSNRKFKKKNPNLNFLQFFIFVPNVI